MSNDPPVVRRLREALQQALPGLRDLVNQQCPDPDVAERDKRVLALALEALMSDQENSTTDLPRGNHASEDNKVIGYMCLIDWQHEIGSAYDGSRIYPDEDDLRKHHPCADACGIVEVEVRCLRLVSPGKGYDDE